MDLEELGDLLLLEAVVELPWLPNSTKNVYYRVVYESGNPIIKVSLIITVPIYFAY